MTKTDRQLIEDIRSGRGLEKRRRLLTALSKSPTGLTKEEYARKIKNATDANFRSDNDYDGFGTYFRLLASDGLIKMKTDGRHNRYFMPSNHSVEEILAETLNLHGEKDRLANEGSSVVSQKKSEAKHTRPSPTSPIDSTSDEVASASDEPDAKPISNESVADSQPQVSSEPMLLSSPEGKRLLKLHSKRERDPKLAKEKKRLSQAEFGCLRCAVCNFDFTERYGTHGDGFIECHHTKPLSDRLEEVETLLEDLELVCANCHRMLHRVSRMLSIPELRAMLRPTT